MDIQFGWKLWIATFLALIDLAISQSTGLREYCDNETFRAQCHRDQVILIETARFGRPTLGKCVKKDLGYLGCVEDITRFMASKCSGKQICEYPVWKPELKNMFQPCPGDVTSHLQVSFRCITVQTAHSSSCNSEGIAVDPDIGYLASHLTETLHIGTVSCPWNIEVGASQRIQLTALNFIDKQRRTVAETNKYRLSNICYKFAKVVDGIDEHELTLCSDNTNETIVYKSKSSSIQVYFTTRGTQSNDISYILSYHGVGCTAPPRMRDATMEVDADNQMATIRCNHSGETWFLICEGTEWHGKAGNCTLPSNVGRAQEWTLFQSSKHFPFVSHTGLIMVVASGVALGVFLGGTALVIVSYRMKRRKYPRYELPPELPSQDYPAPADGSIPPPEKTLRHTQVQLYGGLQPNEVLYDSTLGKSIESVSTTPTKDTLPQQIIHAQNDNNKKRRSGPGSHLYEMPHMM